MSLWNLAPASQSMGFMDYVNKGVGYLGKGANWLSDNHKGIGALGGLYGAYAQQRMGDKQFKMQRDAFNYNKMLSERERKRQEEAEMALQQGFKNSGFGV